jgi:hypothetical protein
MIFLGLLPGTVGSVALAASWDGSVIVGSSQSNAPPDGSGSQAFRWTAANGMVGLGDLPGGILRSGASAVSANGNIVVGLSRSDVGEEMFVWDEARGMRSLPQLLVNEFGLDLTGWTQLVASACSADGRVIVGYGIKQNAYAAWRAVLPACAPCRLHGDNYPASPPQGDCTVDVDDLAYVVYAYGDADPCLNFPGADLVPCGQACVEGAIDVDDLVSIVRSYAGFFDCPSPCQP